MEFVTGKCIEMTMDSNNELIEYTMSRWKWPWTNPMDRVPEHEEHECVHNDGNDRDIEPGVELGVAGAHQFGPFGKDRGLSHCKEGPHRLFHHFDCDPGSGYCFVNTSFVKRPLPGSRLNARPVTSSCPSR